MLRPFKGIWPKLGERVYVDVSAQVIGDVELGDHASVWMNAVVRGDVHSIRIGAYTNIQDNCVVHVFKDAAPDAGRRPRDGGPLGHPARLPDRLLLPDRHGRHDPERRARGRGVASSPPAALIPEGMVVPPRSLVMGVPGKVRRPVTEEEREGLRRYADNYYEYKETYLAEAEPRLSVTIQAVKGTRDILPDEIRRGTASRRWRATLFARYGYREIRTPVFEETELFARGIGADTDIVAKEMYTFEDRDGSSLTLRPEATAGIVRAVHRAQPDEHRPGAQGLRARADVPPRAAAEGPLPAVPSGRRGGLRRQRGRRSTSR